MNKKIWIYLFLSFFIFGLLIGFFHTFLSGDMQMFLWISFGVINGLIVRKKFTKELKGDELQRKVATMSDAVAGRMGLWFCWLCTGFLNILKAFVRWFLHLQLGKFCL